MYSVFSSERRANHDGTVRSALLFDSDRNVNLVKYWIKDGIWFRFASVRHNEVRSVSLLSDSGSPGPSDLVRSRPVKRVRRPTVAGIAKRVGM